MKNEMLIIYKVKEIPDPYYHQYQMAAGGDVFEAVCRDFEHFLRPISNFPTESASVSIRFAFTPNPLFGSLQSRLSIYVLARAYNYSAREILRLLLERGPLGRFYCLKEIKGVEAQWKKLQAGCDIVRREDVVKPLHTPEFNYRIPAYYYTIRPFEPDENNDYRNLDRVLGEIMEEVIIDVCVQPIDISSELLEHTRYLSRLQSINRVWDSEENDEIDSRDYLDEDSIWHSTRRHGIKPLRYQDPLSDDILRLQQRFHKTLRQPHLLFHIKVLTETPAVAQLLGAVIAESAFDEGSYRLLSYNKDDRSFAEALESLKEVCPLVSPAHESFFPKEALTLYSGLIRLCHVSTVDELLGIYRLPVSSITSPYCIRKNTDPPHQSEQNLIAFGYDIETPNSYRGIPLDKLCKHTFVSGTTGAGKTTSVRNLILQLHQHNIPFLAIEPVKTEYRVLKTLRKHKDKNARKLSEKLEIYTPGNDVVSPFRFNPLSLHVGISVDEHVDNILSCFMAAMPVSGPLPALLGEALERVYEEYPDKNNPPIMADLVSASERVLAEKGYSPETNSDIRAALEVRLGVLIRRSIGKVFQCRRSVPHIEHLMKVPAIIELDRLHTEQACLLTLFLLTNIREHLRTASKTDKALRYVIILEEAHNIVGNTGEALPSPDVADPKAFAAEYVVRMLAELRALGVGIVIVDQLPSAVAPEVIKSTTSKLAFRQVAKEDREELGASMLFGKTEIEEIARFEAGEAFFFTEGYYNPRRIKTTNLHDQFDFDVLTINENIIPYLRDDTWFQEAALNRIITELTQLREQMDRFDDERLQIVGELAILLPRYYKIVAQPDTEQRSKELVKMRNKACEFKQRLSSSYHFFLRNSYKKDLDSRKEFKNEDSAVQEMREDLIDRFGSVIEPDVKKSLDMINEFINRCQKS